MRYEQPDFELEIDMQGGKQIKRREIEGFFVDYRPSQPENFDRHVQQITVTSPIKHGGEDGLPKAIIFTKPALRTEGATGITGVTEQGSRFAFSIELVVSLSRRLRDGLVMITYMNKGELTQDILSQSRIIKSKDRGL